MNDLNTFYQIGSAVLYSVRILSPMIHLALEKLEVIQ